MRDAKIFFMFGAAAIFLDVLICCAVNPSMGASLAIGVAVGIAAGLGALFTCERMEPK